jgi:hypothetical protein
MSGKPDCTLDATQRLELATSLDREIRALHQQSNAAQAQIARRLAQMKESRAYLSLVFSSVRDYAWKAIGWRARKVKAVLGLMERLPTQPLIRESFESGELQWTKAVLTSRGAARQPEREAEWRDAGLELTCRQLEQRLSGETGEPVRSGFWLEATEAQRAILQEWLRGLRSEGRRGLTLVEALIELIERGVSAGAVGSSKFRVLLQRCIDCAQTSLVTAEGQLPLDPEHAEALTRGAEHYDATQRGARGDTQQVPKAVEDEVRARAGDCCELPGCTIRDDLHFHHGRGRGRGHDADEILLLCSGHHQAPHSGAVRFRGCRVSQGIEVIRVDGTLLGVVGGAGSREAPAPGETQPRAVTSSLPEGEGRQDSREAPLLGEDERKLALAGLRGLGLSARDAKALLRRAERAQPELARAPAEDQILAALRCT